MKAPAALRRRPVKIVVDIALAVGFVVEFLTRERSFDPDYLLHGWAGIALLGVLALHLGGNSGWIRRVATRRRRDREARLGLLNLGFGVATVVCIVSGIPLWLEWTEAGAVTGVHAGTGFLAIVLMLVHVGWNQRRIRSLVGLGGAAQRVRKPRTAM